MSAGGSFGGARGARPVPPEKGVFPLDHMHQCDLQKKDYLDCLKLEGHKSEKCRLFSKKYLECRMEKNLMAKQDLSELGFRKELDKEASQALRTKYCGWKQRFPEPVEPQRSILALDEEIGEHSAAPVPARVTEKSSGDEGKQEEMKLSWLIMESLKHKNLCRF